MPLASRILVILITLVSMVFIWQAVAVLEARKAWDTAIRKKAEEVSKVDAEVVLLKRGDDEARKKLKDVVEKEILPLASNECNRIYKQKLDSGLDSSEAFVIALDSFVDPKVLESYKAAVANLNELQRTSIIEETQLRGLLRDYETAERELSQQFANLEEANALYFGQKGQTGGIRGIADLRVDGVYRGLGIEVTRNLLVRVGQAIQQQRAVYITALSDGAKNETQLSDKVAATKDAALRLQLAGAAATREAEERKKEEDQANQDLNREKALLADWEKKRDDSIAQLTALQKQFEESVAKCVQLAGTVKNLEIQIDQKRGVRTVIRTPDGRIPSGAVQAVDESDGTIRINLGARDNVRGGAHLHVYRRTPQPKYLGIFEVSESDSSTARGRMLPEYRQLPIRVGDIVTTEITATQSR